MTLRIRIFPIDALFHFTVYFTVYNVLELVIGYIDKAYVYCSIGLIGWEREERRLEYFRVKWLSLVLPFSPIGPIFPVWPTSPSSPVSPGTPWEEEKKARLRRGERGGRIYGKDWTYHQSLKLWLSNPVYRKLIYTISNIFQNRKK